MVSRFPVRSVRLLMFLSDPVAPSPCAFMSVREIGLIHSLLEVFSSYRPQFKRIADKFEPPLTASR